MLGFICPDGTIINAEDYNLKTHNALEKFLHLNKTGKYLDCIHYHKYIRINDGCIRGYEDEIVAELPDIITEMQCDILTKWLDELSYIKPFVYIEIDAEQSYNHIKHDCLNTKFFKQYYFKETSVDDIIKDIKRYYNQSKSS